MSQPQASGSTAGLIETAVAAAVPEAVRVRVSTMRSGLSSTLNVEIIVNDPNLVTVDFIERTFRAAWFAGGGSNSRIGVDPRMSDGGAVPLEPLLNELPIGGPATFGVSASSEDLEAYFAER